jgi:prepilin-type N-terminal cleavage/methylation domain-containing protein
MRRDRGEGGFTLMELLLVIAILGFIVVPLAAAITVGLRTTDSTSNRLASSHDAQLVSIYLPADIQSAGSQTDDVLTDPANTDCSGVSNVLRLRWTTNEDLATPHTYIAAYTVAQSGSEWQLKRWYCVDSTQATATVVAHNLNGASAIDVSPQPPVAPAISVTITEAKAVRDASNYQYTISGTRRTP